MAPKKSPKDPETMTASAINRELDRLQVETTAWCDRMIAAGRGREYPAETYLKSDPLAQECRRLTDRENALREEVKRRGGPSLHRLPARGFGPRRKG